MVTWKEETRPPAGEAGETLVVDDDPLVRESMVKVLDESGIPCTGRDSLAGALAYLQEGPPELLITDIMLGDGTGLELLEWVAHRYPRLQVILVTGRPDTGHIHEALRHQACDYVAKPVSPQMLLAAVRRARERRRLQENLIQLREMNDLLCQVMARAVEAKDRFTAGHSQRVASYAQHLALHHLGFPEELARDLYMAGQLHDIGKIGIEDRILTAPRRLEEDEWAQIRRHPATALAILDPLPRMDAVKQWIYEHHERWNGKGYPRGLKGEQISLPGRILILVEVFDALNTRRSYKEAWSRERILEYYRSERGEHFDPELCDLLVEGLDREGKAFLGAPCEQGLFS